MLIGYMRPNADDIQCHIQYQILTSLNCDHLFTEEHSSPKKRVVLKKMMSELQPGDTIIVSKLFSLADSTRHLADLLHQISDKQAYLLSVGEGIDTRNSTGYSFHDSVNHLLSFQRDVISENTKKGLYEAKQNGITAGRPRKPDENVKRAISMYESKKYSLAQIKEETGISKTTLYRYLES
ncbi:recombinase family protein [Brevibacillus invocatus]|uniref:Recombinase family protein n=2 Tax=Paenibacillaceae TaxID=186822 RepID=A0A3M8CLI9_9BACL|nr:MULTISPECIES: recombinase family protein [Paenibacillaceae]MCM3131116.1 recombinase family protein [Paenibacillus sp. MER 78]MEC2133353.1 recombinase family protein [Brevibacillus centrosporus]RNB76524.1 recombinase family protein [Brevibacillus invocatus]SDX89917.1 Site-specific DNA recombinase [Paenibacillus sp. PDC88]GED34524.1 resolvase [Brevibacillus centrosporus]